MRIAVTRSCPIRIAPLLLAVTACGGFSQLAEAQSDTPRSLAWPRQNPAGQLAHPRYHERQTHVGFEVRTSQLVVLSKRSAAEARRAAAQIETTWARLKSPAGRRIWSERAVKRPIIVTIDNQPPRRRERPVTPLQMTQGTLHITIDTSPGRPSLQQQAAHLQRTAAHAFLYSAGIDEKLPSWVRLGLVDFAVSAAARKKESQATAHGRVPEDLRRQVDPQRAAPDRLRSVPPDTEAAARWVRFLIKGDDARRAPEFLAAVDNLNATKLEQMHTDPLVRGRLKQWREDPTIGRPQVDWLSDAEVPREHQQELALILKLAHRKDLSSPPDNTTIRARITGFDGGGQRLLRQRTRPALQAYDLAELRQRLLAAEQSWAALDVDGQLLWSDDAARLNELLGRNAPYDSRLQKIKGADGEKEVTRRVMRRRFDDGRYLHAWWEPNRDGRRPTIRFQVTSQRRPAP